MIDANIVIAHNNENLNWVTKLIYPFTIYSSHSIKEGYASNVSREVNVYLKYIIDNYNNLSTFTIFLHGHETAWHQEESIVETIKKLKFNKKYYNINVNKRELIKLNCTPYISRFLNNKQLNNIIFNHLGIKFNYNNYQLYRSKHNAQFYVHKDLIKRYTLNQWKSLYNELYNYKKYGISSYEEGIVYETLWFYIFTQQLVDSLTEN